MIKRYILSHWRGEQSFIRAFLLNGLLLPLVFETTYILISGAFVRALYANDPTGYPWLPFILPGVNFILMIALCVWVCVGIAHYRRKIVAAPETPKTQKMYTVALEFLVALGLFFLGVNVLIALLAAPSLLRGP